MRMEKIVQSFRDDRSMELYGKPESKLQLGEIQRLNEYIHDWNNPIWKPVIIDGKETNYEVSNIGKIRNINTSKIIVAITDKDGYLMTFIPVNHKLIGKGIHRFVAIAFIPNDDNKPQVNHINGIKTCNWVGNLEWVTCKENIQKAHEIGLYPSQRGEKNNNSKFKENEIKNAIAYISDNPNMSYTELSKKLQMSRTFLWNIKYGKRWGHLNVNKL